MLISYKFRNYCSFCEMAEFDMLAPANKVKNRFPDNFIETEEGYDILKTAVIIGENAGGKTNFINSLSFLKAYKPKLAISIYHNGEDYYRLPLLIKKLVPEYKIAIRHHKKIHVDTDMYCWC